MARRRAPLREQRFRIWTPLAGMVFGAVAVVLPLGRHGSHAMPWWAVGVLVVIVGGVGFVALLVGLRLGDRIVGDRIEAAVREPGGRWRHGRCSFDGTDVLFQQYRWQMRIPSRRTERLSAVLLGPDTGRRPPATAVLDHQPAAAHRRPAGARGGLRAGGPAEPHRGVRPAPPRAPAGLSPTGGRPGR